MKKRGNNLGLKQNINPCLGSVRAKKKEQMTKERWLYDQYRNET